MESRAIVVIVAVVWLLAGSGATITDAQCTENSSCGISQYCQKTQGDCDGEGTCSARPLMCPDIWDPVCGCDNVTYGNSCEAGFAGINVATEGVCPQPSCRTNRACESGEYCLKPTGDCDGEGICSTQPFVCPDIWDPVCGCDDITYGNDCEAALAGINVATEGVCPPPPCQNNDVCASGFFCLKASGNCLGDGQCSEEPTICPATWDPVCGCDDITYPNECSANLAGVSVAYDGECLTACETSADCFSTEYCDTAHNGCWEAGACRVKPDICTEEYDPVCGCNEVTFENACLAGIASMTVAKPGTCGACPYDSSADCLFSDSCETGGTDRWSRTVGN